MASHRTTTNAAGRVLQLNNEKCESEIKTSTTCTTQHKNSPLSAQQSTSSHIHHNHRRTTPRAPPPLKTQSCERKWRGFRRPNDPASTPCDLFARFNPTPIPCRRPARRDGPAQLLHQCKTGPMSGERQTWALRVNILARVYRPLDGEQERKKRSLKKGSSSR